MEVRKSTDRFSFIPYMAIINVVIIDKKRSYLLTISRIHMKNRDFALAVTCLVIGFAYRLIPHHPPNVTPIAAMALVGGLYINRKALAFIFPVGALILSDLVLNNTINRGFFTEQTGMVLWADYMLYTYAALLLTVVIGRYLVKASAGAKIIGGALFSSVAFFLITNFGSWLTLPMYPKSPAGLLLSYEAGVPFFRNTLLGNLVFCVAFIGSIELYKYLSARRKGLSQLA